MSTTVALDLRCQVQRLDEADRLLTPPAAPEKKLFRRAEAAPAPSLDDFDHDLLAPFVVTLVRQGRFYPSTTFADRFFARTPADYKLAIHTMMDGLLWFDGPQLHAVLTMTGGPAGLLALLDALAASGGMLPPIATGLVVAGASGLRRRVSDATLVVQYAAAHVGFPLVSGPPAPYGAAGRRGHDHAPGAVRHDDW